MFGRMNGERRSKKVGRRTSHMGLVPPPVGGWNVRDLLPSMDPSDAVTLDNFVPDTNKIASRNGYEIASSGMNGAIETLMAYSPSDSSASKLFAASPSAIFDVSAFGGNVSVGVQSGLANGRWQHTMFAATGGTFLYMVNGQDAVRYTDGTTWTQPAITGTTPANFINVCSHQNRLWFVEKASLNAWYLPVASIAGAATKFPLGPLATLGGELLAMGSWTVDGGAGMDDMAVFITSKGEAIVYSGTDPASASTWKLVGRFKIPPPIGRRCLVKAGADLSVLTVAGVLLMSEVMGSGESGQAKAAVTDKISGAFLASNTSYGTNFGWEMVEYAPRNLLIVNIPTAQGVTAVQYVCNLRTGAWCRFTGLNAQCWANHAGRLYFGLPGGVVARYSTEYKDNGAAIVGRWQGAFSTFNSPAIKVLRGARPVMLASGGYTPSIEARLDYSTEPATLEPRFAPAIGPPWDTIDWDVEEWGSDPQPTAGWQTLVGQGLAVSLTMQFNLTQELVLNQVDVLYETGGVL